MARSALPYFYSGVIKGIAVNHGLQVNFGNVPLGGVDAHRSHKMMAASDDSMVLRAVVSKRVCEAAELLELADPVGANQV